MREAASRGCQNGLLRSHDLKKHLYSGEGPMTKSLKRGKKLDTILSEVNAIKIQLRKLIRQQTALSDEITKLARLMPSRKRENTNRQRQQVGKLAQKKKGPMRPVLVQTSKETTPHHPDAADLRD